MAPESTLSGQPLREAAGNADDPVGEPGDKKAAVKAAATVKPEDAEKLTPQAQTDALEWFVGIDEDEAPETKPLKLNFGTDETPKWITWTICPVSMETMRAIRQRATQSRAARRTGSVDEYRVNLEVVAAGTVDPDLQEAARRMHEAKTGPLDPVECVRIRFQKKPGFIAQIAGHIMSLSGFDDDDVQEVEQVAAAGNS